MSEPHDHYDFESDQTEFIQELADYNDQWAASNEDGWFYPDED